MTSGKTLELNSMSRNISSDITAVSTNKWKISATWDYIIDEESDIKRVSVCATTSKEDCNLLLWRDLIPISSVFSLDFHKSLQSGIVLMLKLRVENSSGLKTTTISNRVLIDSSPPVKGVVKVNGKESFVVLKEGQPLFASWWGFDDFQSGIKEYQWKICFAVKISDCITEFVRVGLKSQIVLSDMGIDHGKEYQFVVKAVDFAGLDATVVSNSFILDKTYPETGVVFNGQKTFEDRFFQSSSTEISARWEGFRDQESGISLYEICIGSISGLCDIAEFKNVGLVTNTIVRNLNLTHNATYYTTVQATNGAGQTCFASSSGITVDLTPPIGGKLRDGNYLDKNVTVQDIFVSMSWDEFNDPESGISKYVLCTGTIVGACDLVSRTTVNNGLAAKLNVCPAISSGTVVYSTLWTYNKAGGVTEIFSNGVLVDTTPPISGIVSIYFSFDSVYITSWLFVCTLFVMNYVTRK